MDPGLADADAVVPSRIAAKVAMRTAKLITGELGSCLLIGISNALSCRQHPLHVVT